MDNGECQEIYNKFNEEKKGRNFKIFDEQVCAGYAEGKIDGCGVSFDFLLISTQEEKGWKVLSDVLILKNVT